MPVSPGAYLFIKEEDNLKNLNILLIGPQGSGKTVQGKRISDTYRIPWISTGEIFRDNIQKNTPLGNLVKPIIERGDLISDDITFELIKDRLSKGDVKKGFVLDGFPRNLNQAKSLNNLTEISIILYIKLDDNTAIERLSNRRSCIECGQIFNLLTNPSKKLNLCDSCGSQLIQREEDTEHAIKKRLMDFHRLTEPVLDFYRNKVIEIDGSKSIDEVSHDINKATKTSLKN